MWRMSLKASSKSFIQAVGAQRHADADPGWQHAERDEFLVLGHWLNRDGGMAADVRQAELAVWRRFFCGAGASRSRDLPRLARVKDIERTCWPAINLRCARWHMGRHKLSRIDALQRRLIACVIREPRHPSEEDSSYFRRRGRIAASIARDAGLWSERVARQMLRWHARMSAPAYAGWAQKLVNWRGRDWLQNRRLRDRLVVGVRRTNLYKSSPWAGQLAVARCH